LNTFIQNFAPSVVSIHRPRISREPSRRIPSASYTALLRTTSSSRTFTRNASKKTTGYTVSSGRACQGVTSASTPSVTVLISSGAHLGAVAFSQVALNLAHRQAARIQRDDAVVERGEPARMFGQQQRLETAVPVARRLDAYAAVAGQHRLGSDTVALVGRGLRPVRARRVAQMVRQLGAQRGFDQRLFEGDPRRVDRLTGHRTGEELSDKLLRD
jgi:hypothetical protein